MIKQAIINSALKAAILLSSESTFAADQVQIYGSQLMTQQERLEYRKKYTHAKTAREREQIRVEHHAMIKERARERNMNLPEIPPASGAGMSPGGAMQRGSSMGPGAGSRGR